MADVQVKSEFTSAGVFESPADTLRPGRLKSGSSRLERRTGDHETYVTFLSVCSATDIVTDIVVTGGLGRSGRWIVDRFVEDGSHVTIVDQRQPTDDPFEAIESVDYRKIDITNGADILELLHEVDPSVVVHWAAYTSTDHSAPGRVFRNNVISTYYTLMAAGQAGADVVFASSDAVYGYEQLPMAFPITVDEPRCPADAYSLSKLVSEEIGRTVVRKYGIGVRAIRTTWIQYPGEYDCLNVQQAAEYGTVNYWSYCDIRDVVSAVKAATQTPSAGFQAFNVIAAENYMDRPTLDLLRDHFDSVPDETNLTGEESVYSLQSTTEILDWAPAHSWHQAATEELEGPSAEDF